MKSLNLACFVPLAVVINPHVFEIVEAFDRPLGAVFGGLIHGG
jgi:hypothetical protein